jgi:HPr kinase/phosphorylase
MRIHASCAARPGPDGDVGVLLCGPPGCGKSDLLLRLIHDGWRLVADDQVLVENRLARPPAALAGLLEVRGLGLFRLDFLGQAPLRLMVRLGLSAVRLPEPAWEPQFGLPVVTIDPFAASAPARVKMALDGATGRFAQLAGAFAA